MDDHPDRPMFRLGQGVRVVTSERHQTLRLGIVDRIVWHFKKQRNLYFLFENRKRVSTAYLAIDLEPVADPPAET